MQQVRERMTQSFQCPRFMGLHRLLGNTQDLGYLPLAKPFFAAKPENQPALLGKSLYRCLYLLPQILVVEPLLRAVIRLRKRSCPLLLENILRPAHRQPAQNLIFNNRRNVSVKTML